MLTIHTGNKKRQTCGHCLQAHLMCSVGLSVDVGEQLHPQFGIFSPNSSAFWPVKYVCLGSEACSTTWNELYIHTLYRKY